MDLSFNLAPSYRDLKDPTSRQNFEDTPGQIPKLILTLRLNKVQIYMDLTVKYPGFFLRLPFIALLRKRCRIVLICQKIGLSVLLTMFVNTFLWLTTLFLCYLEVQMSGGRALPRNSVSWQHPSFPSHHLLYFLPLFASILSIGHHRCCAASKQLIPNNGREERHN